MLKIGLLIINQRGVTHSSDIQASQHAVPAHWISKFGSITFNQYGRNFPSGGMNEAGLVVELMWAYGVRPRNGLHSKTCIDGNAAQHNSKTPGYSFLAIAPAEDSILHIHR